MTGELEKRIQTTEMKYFCRLLGMSYKSHNTNAELRNKITKALWP